MVSFSAISLFLSIEMGLKDCLSHPNRLQLNALTGREENRWCERGMNEWMKTEWLNRRTLIPLRGKKRKCLLLLSQSVYLSFAPEIFQSASKTASFGIKRESNLILSRYLFLFLFRGRETDRQIETSFHSRFLQTCTCNSCIRFDIPCLCILSFFFSSCLFKPTSDHHMLTFLLNWTWLLFLRNAMLHCFHQMERKRRKKWRGFNRHKKVEGRRILCWSLSRHFGFIFTSFHFSSFFVAATTSVCC